MDDKYGVSKSQQEGIQLIRAGIKKFFDLSAPSNKNCTHEDGEAIRIYAKMCPSCRSIWVAVGQISGWEEPGETVEERIKR